MLTPTSTPRPHTPCSCYTRYDPYANAYNREWLPTSAFTPEDRRVGECLSASWGWHHLRRRSSYWRSNLFLATLTTLCADIIRDCPCCCVLTAAAKGGWIWEHKFEVDSGAYFFNLVGAGVVVWWVVRVWRKGVCNLTGLTDSPAPTACLYFADPTLCSCSHFTICRVCVMLCYLPNSFGTTTTRPACSGLSGCSTVTPPSMMLWC